MEFTDFGVAEISRLLAMSDTCTVRKGLAKQVEERAREGRCLLCDEKADRRGICFRHYHLFRRRLMSKPKNQQAAFETAAIKEGKILPVNRMRALKFNDPFADL